MLYEDVDFKTLSVRYTNSRMVPFLTHIDGVRANLFSINPRQNMTHQKLLLLLFFFHRKIGCNKLFFPSNTAEVRPIYLQMDNIMRNPVFVICEQQKGADQPAHPRSPISAFVVRCLDSNEILQYKDI